MKEAEAVKYYLSEIEARSEKLNARELEFVENVSSYLDNGRDLSKKQMDWLVAIYERLTR